MLNCTSHSGTSLSESFPFAGLSSEISLSDLYGYSQSNNHSIQVRVLKNGSPEVFFNNQQITNNYFIEFDASVDSLGNTLWSLVEDSNDKADLVINGNKVTDDDLHHYSGVIHEGSFYWLTFNPSDDSYLVNIYRMYYQL